jgi:creatinine amidohydrolase
VDADRHTPPVTGPTRARESPGDFAAQLSWPELERRLSEGVIAVLPVGAACKAHGPHLPMNADLLQAEWLAATLVQRPRVLVWPTVAYGYYPAFTDYPGSVSLSRATFQSVVEQILADIWRSGARSLLILNTGISTTEPLRAAADAAPQQLRVGLANLYEGPRYRSLAETVEEQPRGGHADELETSIMLAIDPQLVDSDQARVWTPAATVPEGPFSRSDAQSPSFSPWGIWGDPTLAREEKGHRLLDAMLEDLLAELETLADGT